ncbi:drug/metabolite transporter (DMT)-like permease [Kribbella amoyensis]|uniref:Drug/metabolite transporter (DMT)-like permease n=1 Tax=Kribbella amoyensis TaxID=996641 RepID=A0A561BN92_9ACTN|nr:EamA family transporter [Kribbella amoyensis]TWD80360.1 drug/metabolite transporter (DMT)-like permease [Kribbella amoyensis]
MATTSAPAVRPDLAAHQPSAAMIWTALAVVYVVWGSTYLAIRIVVEAQIPPMLGMAARFLIAATLLATFLVVRSGGRRLRVTRSELLGAGTVGLLLLALGNGAVAVAEQTVPSGLAALLVAAVPLWLMLLRVGGGERPRLLTWAGVLIGFGGAALLSVSGGDTSAKPLSVGILVLGTICWAIGSRFSPRLGLPKDPLVATVYEMAIGGAAMVLIGVLRGEPGRLHLGAVDTKGWFALAYLVGFGSLIAYSAYTYLLANAPISLIGTYAYVNPAVAVFLGWLILDEHVTAKILLGGAVVVLGVALVVSAERRPRAAAVPADPAPPDPAVPPAPPAADR